MFASVALFFMAAGVTACGDYEKIEPEADSFPVEEQTPEPVETYAPPAPEAAPPSPTGEPPQFTEEPPSAVEEVSLPQSTERDLFVIVWHDTFTPEETQELCGLYWEDQGGVALAIYNVFVENGEDLDPSTPYVALAEICEGWKP